MPPCMTFTWVRWLPWTSPSVFLSSWAVAWLVGVVDSTFAVNETTTTSTSRTGCQAGAYAEAGLAYRVCPAASLFGGAQFQYLGDFNQNIGGHSAQLDLSQSIFCVLGFEFHF